MKEPKLLTQQEVAKAFDEVVSSSIVLKQHTGFGDVFTANELIYALELLVERHKERTGETLCMSLCVEAYSVPIVLDSPVFVPSNFRARKLRITAVEAYPASEDAPNCYAVVADYAESLPQQDS